MQIRENESLPSITLAIFMFFAAISAAIAQQESVEVTIRVTGSIDDYRRDSDNYMQTVVQTTTNSKFTEESKFTLFRDTASGDIGAMSMNDLQRIAATTAHVNLMEPTFAFEGTTQHSISGTIKVDTCIPRGGVHVEAPVGSQARIPGAPANLPPGMSLPSGMTLPNIERGIYLFQTCSSDKNKVLIFYSPPEGFFQIPAASPIHCNDGYSYEREEGPSEQYKSYLLENDNKQALAGACPGHPLPEDLSFLGAVNWSDLKAASTNSLHRTITGTEGSPSAEEFHEKQTLKVDLDLNYSDIEAIPKGSDVLRAQMTTLDGLASKPSKGRRIQTYEWTLTPIDCPKDSPPSVTLQGGVIKVRPLCSFTARLKVDDGRAHDEKTITIKALARDFNTKRPAAVSGTLTGVQIVKPCGCNFGKNICAIEYGKGKMSSLHWIHTNTVGNYDGIGYLLAQNSDPSGLFNQWWYVSESKLEMPRAELLNEQLQTNGIIYDTNSRANAAMVQSGQSAPYAIDELVAMVREHEKIHTRLANQQLKSNDPAKKIEPLIAKPGLRADLVHDADSEIAQAETRITDAADEPQVKAVLSQNQRWLQGVKVLLRFALTQNFEEYPFKPLWSAADDNPLSP
jgi:hypothetical protein